MDHRQTKKGRKAQKIVTDADVKRDATVYVSAGTARGRKAGARTIMVSLDRPTADFLDFLSYEENHGASTIVRAILRDLAADYGFDVYAQ